MIKRICDVCGKDISTNTDTDIYELRIKPKANIRREFGNDIIFCQDVCKDCANTICHYIKGLTKED